MVKRHDSILTLKTKKINELDAKIQQLEGDLIGAEYKLNSATEAQLKAQEQQNAIASIGSEHEAQLQEIEIKFFNQFKEDKEALMSVL